LVYLLKIIPIWLDHSNNHHSVYFSKINYIQLISAIPTHYPHAMRMNRSTSNPDNKQYVALIGDMIRSRRFTGAARYKLQGLFNELINSLNEQFGRSLRSAFTVTLGDEFQGLLSEPSCIAEVLWALQQFPGLPQLRLGIGLGRIDTAIPPTAINLDGPAFHNARAAIMRAKSEKISGAMFLGFGEQIDCAANGIARMMEFHLEKRSKKQREVMNLLRQQKSQVEIAIMVGASPQAVNRHKQAAGWEAFHAGEMALQQVLTLATEERAK